MAIKDVSFDCYNVEVQPGSRYQLGVSVSGAEIDTVLANFSIDEVIEHFGVSELLDGIGESETREHFGFPDDSDD